MRSSLRALVLAFGAIAAQTVLAQNQEPVVLRVRALDSHTHRSLSGIPLQLTFTDMQGQWVNNGLMLKSKTGKDGVARFTVNQPIPPRASVFVWFGSLCARPDEFQTRQTVEQGVVMKWLPARYAKTDGWCSADAGEVEPASSPREIVILVHRTNRFVWAWCDTWR